MKKANVKSRSAWAALVLAGILGFSPLLGTAGAADLVAGQTLNVATGQTGETLTYNEPFTLSGGTVNFGSANDQAGAINASGKVTLNSGEITVTGSGTKVSGALQMRPDNPKSPAVVPGSTNTFIPDTNPALVPPVHSITSGAAGMAIGGGSINLGAPRYSGGPSAADVSKSWEGMRLDLRTTGGGHMAISGGDFRVANIAFPIKSEKDAALRFDSSGALTVSGGKFTLEGQGVANPSRSNYDAPSLMTLKARNDLTITGGVYDIKSARMHLASTDGKVVINNGTFNIDNTSPYPAWRTFDMSGNTAVVRPPSANTQDKYSTFGSLDVASVFEVNGGTFNIGSAGNVNPATGNNGVSYINMADKTATFNGGTFNIYNGSNFGNNKAAMLIKGGTYNLINGGYVGGRNFSDGAVRISGGTFNIHGGNGRTVAVLTEAPYLNTAKNNKSSVDISGGTFNYYSLDPNRTESSQVYADYAVNISGGEFVRRSDGVNAITAHFVSAGQTSGSVAATSGDLNISGGVFRTANPVNYVRQNNVVVSRDDNVRLYYNPSGSPSAANLSLYTEAQVNAVFDSGDAAAIRKAFGPVNNPGYTPSRGEVLNALHAANATGLSEGQEAWRFEAQRNMNITGGHFDMTTLNKSVFTAGGVLNWSNANMLISGGGGSVDIIGKQGINILNGSIRSQGSDLNGPFALHYDDRGRANRDRWTLGKYLNFSTDGDMVMGAKGALFGPEIYYSEGMLGLATVTPGATPGNLYIYSGNLTLDGQYRSTLTMGNMKTVLDGGTLSINTAERINRNGVDNASMWASPLTMKSGVLNLHNAQIYPNGAGAETNIYGGTVNMTGDSALTGYTGNLNIYGGFINAGPQSYIGAIKGDNLSLSPYVTANAAINIGPLANLNFTVAPSGNHVLTPGKNIAGIYNTTDNINIAQGVSLTVANPLQILPGTYIAPALVESAKGQLNMPLLVTDKLFYTTTLGKNTDNRTANMLLNIKNPALVIGGLPGSTNVRDNNDAFADMLRSGQGPWRNVARVVSDATPDQASEMLRQVGAETSTATANLMVGNVAEFRNRTQSWGKSNISGLSSGDAVNANGYRGWITGMGNWANQADADGRSGYDASSGGIALGFDRTFADRYTVGLSAGYAKGYSQSKDGLSDVNGDTWLVSLYASLDFNPIVIDADVTYANTQSRISNTINLPGMRAENSADFTTDAWAFGLKGSWIFRFNNDATKIAPYVGIQYLSVTQHGYSESGALARSFGSDTSYLWTLPVGVKASHEFRGETWSFTPELGIGYARDLNEFKPAAHVSVPGMNSTITAYGPQLSPDSLRGNAGFTMKYKDNLEVFAMYNLDVRDKFSNQSVTAGFSYSF